MSSEILGYACGVFDLFHGGHQNYLSLCKRHCDYLIVGVDSNERVKKRKGEERPFEDEITRLSNVKKFADDAFIKRASTSYYINKFSPQIIFYPSNKPNLSIKKELLRKIVNDIEVLTVEPTPNISTTDIVTNIFAQKNSNDGLR